FLIFFGFKRRRKRATMTRWSPTRVAAYAHRTPRAPHLGALRSNAALASSTRPRGRALTQSAHVGASGRTPHAGDRSSAREQLDSLCESDPNINTAREPRVEGQDCGERRRTVSRVRVDLVCCGAGHQADPLSIRPSGVLPRSSLENS